MNLTVRHERAVGCLLAVLVAATVAVSYQLNLDGELETGVKEWSCKSYCSNCNCTAEFLVPDNRCVCACPDMGAVGDCFDSVKETNDLLGISYDLEVRPKVPRVRRNAKFNRTMRKRLGSRKPRRKNPLERKFKFQRKKKDKIAEATEA